MLKNLAEIFDLELISHFESLISEIKKNVKDNLFEAKIVVIEGIALDVVSIYLKNAYDALKDILGEEVSVDLEKEIFSRFCLGK